MLDKLFERIRQDQHLAFLDAELYANHWKDIVSGKLGLTFPDTKAPYPVNYGEFHNAFYFCSSLIQLMENVFLDLNFEENDCLEHPHNKGWRELFKLWANSDTLRKTWEISRATYSERFQKFAEEKLNLPSVLR